MKKITSDNIKKHIKKAKKIANLLYKEYSSRFSYDELESYALTGLYDALMRFDNKRNIKFSTYAYSRIYGHIIDNIRMELKTREAKRYNINIVSYNIYRKKEGENRQYVDFMRGDERLYPHNIIEKKIEEEEIWEYIEIFLNKTEKKVITLYFFENMTLKQIGKVLDLTGSRIGQILSFAKKKLKKEMENKIEI